VGTFHVYAGSEFKCINS